MKAAPEESRPFFIGGITGQIGPGLLVFLGVAEEDEQADLDKIVKKVTELRIFKDDAGKTNLSLQDVNGELLVVSQFTLLADCKKRKKAKVFVKSGETHRRQKKCMRSLYEYVRKKCRR